MTCCASSLRRKQSPRWMRHFDRHIERRSAAISSAAAWAEVDPSSLAVLAGFLIGASRRVGAAGADSANRALADRGPEASGPDACALGAVGFCLFIGRLNRNAFIPQDEIDDPLPSWQ